ncbi:MAG TPA: helix-turn-helix domain-containing protein [Devosiaceae bacterium]|nr:helix-turn-helix domain-containing protein [Devosiaceae bacterium]
MPRPAQPGVDHLRNRILDLVAASRRVAPAELTGPGRASAGVAFARQIGMYLHHVVLGATLTAAGDAFARDRTTAAYACARVEDRRDDVSFDFQLRCLEDALRLACQGTGSAGRRRGSRR